MAGRWWAAAGLGFLGAPGGRRRGPATVGSGHRQVRPRDGRRRAAVGSGFLWRRATATATACGNGGRWRRLAAAAGDDDGLQQRRAAGCRVRQAGRGRPPPESDGGGGNNVVVLIHGQPGEKVSLELILRVVADIGLVNGLCAVGSWHVSFLFISRLSLARPRTDPPAAAGGEPSGGLGDGGRATVVRQEESSGGRRSCARQPSPARIGGARRQRDDAGCGVGRIH